MEKKGYTLPRSCMTNTDIARIINSNEVQSALAPQKTQENLSVLQRKNPLKNNSVLGRLCPYATAQKKIGKLAHTAGSSVQKANAAKKVKKAASTKKHLAAKRQFYRDLQGAYNAAPAADEE